MRNIRREFDKIQNGFQLYKIVINDVKTPFVQNYTFVEM